jgi:hypothetical protein
MQRINRGARPLGGTGPGPKLKHAPFPGLIDGHAWTIKEGRWPSYIDRRDLEGEGGVMQVPLGDDATERKLRLHEQAHVGWTPNISDEEIIALEIEPPTVNACEDGRIIQLMNHRNAEWRDINLEANIVPDVLWARHQADFERLAGRLAGNISMEVQPHENPLTLLDAARIIASTRGYAEGPRFDQIADNVGLGWITKEIDRMHKEFLRTPSRWRKNKKAPTFGDTLDYARELERFFGEMELELIRQAQEFEEADLDNPALPERIDEMGEWGEMRIEHAPLTQRLQGAPGLRTRPTDLGAVPRYMHRLVSDQRIFGRKRKQQRFQGTVLIDHSGSMSLHPGEVDEILFNWPAVTIATYSGNSNGTGVLRIVAEKGRRASVEWLNSPAEGDNMIDGPALDWLGRQKGPRVWISDGEVTGIGGQTQWLLLDAARKVNRGRIKRIENVRELLNRA